MATQEPTAAPASFVRILRQAIGNQGLSLREIARQIGASTAYMSRLVNEKRGVPADDMIGRLEEVLGIERGLLRHAAGRHDAISRRVAQRESTRVLMRTLTKLTDEQIAEVQAMADELAKKRPVEAK